MELEEEAEEEELDTSIYLIEHNVINKNNGRKVRWVFNKGLNLGKKMLVAGFVASSAPIVVPPLVVASAIGLAVSMPFAFFLASHACTQNLMSKLLPTPTPQNPLLLEESSLEDERKRDVEMVDVQGNEYEQEVVEKDEQEVLCSQDVCDVIQDNGSMKDSSEFFFVEAFLEKHNIDNVELEDEIDDGIVNHEGEEGRPMSGVGEVITRIEGFDEIGNEDDEFETPLKVTRLTTIVLEESLDEGEESDNDIEGEELQRETKGLLEKMRDEGRSDRRGEYVQGSYGETKGEATNEDDVKVCEGMLLSRNDENEDTMTCNEVESGEPFRGLLEGKEVDNTNELQKPMAEVPSEDGRCFPYETSPAEPIGDLPIEARAFNISFDEDSSSEVTIEKTDMHITFEEDPMPLPDGPTMLLEGMILDNDISDFVNEESQLHAYNELMESSDADARENAGESGLDLFDGRRIDPENYGYTIELQEESSNLIRHTASMEVLVSSVEQESGPSECSSGKSRTCPSQEVVINEENIWKQIHVIRKIVGYDGTIQASCIDEMKALYIFTGVEPPTSLNENSGNAAEIKEKLHFLMSIVGIKSNEA